MRRTKIIATLGPSTGTVEIMKELIKSGLNVARINFSHGDADSHTEVVNKFKQAREELNAPCALMLDTKGPEIRLKGFVEDEVYLEGGSVFTITSEDVEGDKNKASVTYQNIHKDVVVGTRILLDDGLIELKVRKISGKDVVCEVINSGYVSSNKGVNIPDVHLSLPFLTERDTKDILFGIEMGFDYIAASFIRNANDVLKIKEILEKNKGEHIKIISKIENREGINNIDSILEVSDGIMVARGDLGVEIPPEEVPLAQKLLIRKAMAKCKAVITATQMLESMIKNPRPTRAEANDVANAIYDGTDAIMLSGETAKGEHPVESVKMMARIARTTENDIDYYKKMSNKESKIKTNITNSISRAICTTAADLNAACIVAVTDSGVTAIMVSGFRPACPILAVTCNKVLMRQLSLIWGCLPVYCENLIGNNHVFDTVVEKSQEVGIAKDGDLIVIAAGFPVGIAGTTNTLKVQMVGNVLAKGRGIGKGVVTGKANVIKVEDTEKYFTKGDILVATRTTNEMMPLIRKAGALVVGSWEKEVDSSHAEIAAKALDIPIIICKERVVDLISDGMLIVVDAEKGFVHNGDKLK